MAEGFFASSMLARGQKNGLIEIRTHQLRDWTSDKHNKTDELPYGGGAGMVMKPEPIFAAVVAVVDGDEGDWEGFAQIDLEIRIIHILRGVA